MTSATIDYEVKRQVELARSMEQEINRRVEQELQRVPCYAAKSNPPPPVESEYDEDHTASAFNNQLKQPSNKVRYHICKYILNPIAVYLIVFHISLQPQHCMMAFSSLSTRPMKMVLSE